MIINNSGRVVSSKNITENGSFKISASSHAFRILSDGLYSDKIRAILRELSCNAIDATKAANSEKPFEVYLPTTLEPVFKIRDYGVGLSHDNVMHLFTTYFLSDKNGSNDSIGGFGLGSKSPFAYTDSFSVTSYFNGMKSTYSAFISDQDCPQIVLLSQEDTTDHNGLEISFPVKSEDFHSFKTKLRDVCLYFQIKPVVFNTVFEHVDQEYIIKEEKWGERLSDYKKCQVIMGGVAYPIEQSIFDDEEDGVYRYIVRYMRLDLFMEIGSVSVNPSRESLNYKKADKEAIKLFIDTTVIPSVSNALQKELDSSNGLWDAYVKLNNECRRSDLIKKITKEGIQDFYYHGTLLNKEGDLKECIHLDADIGVYLCMDNSWAKRKILPLTSDRKIVSLTPKDNMVIIFDDLKRGGKQRIDFYLKTNKTQIAIVVDAPTEIIGNYSKQNISQMFCGANVLIASELDQKPKKVVNQQTYKYFISDIQSISIYPSQIHDTKDDFLKMCEEDAKNGVTIFCQQYHKSDTLMVEKSILYTYKSLRKYSLIDKVKFIYVPAGGKLFKIISNFSNVVDVNSHNNMDRIKEMVHKKIETSSRSKMMFEYFTNLACNHTDFSHRWNDLIRLYSNHRSGTINNADLDKFCVNGTLIEQKMNRLVKKLGTDALGKMMSFFKTNTQENQSLYLETKYPLVNLLVTECRPWQLEENIDHIIKYMNSVTG